MYQQSELPYAEIVIKENDSKEYLNNIFEIIKELEFRVVRINCDYSNIMKNILEKLIKLNNKKVFFIPVCFSSSITGNNLCFYNETYVDELCFKYHDNNNPDVIFLNFDLNKSRMDKQVFEYCQWKKPKKLYLELSNSFDQSLESFWDAITQLQEHDIEFSFNTLFKSYYDIVQHPCNAYLCNGTNCHSNKSKFPRYLYIDNRGIRPYRANKEAYMFFFDISENRYENIIECFEHYLESDKYINFRQANKKIYRNFVITQIIKIFPWNYLLDYVEEI